MPYCRELHSVGISREKLEFDGLPWGGCTPCDWRRSGGSTGCERRSSNTCASCLPLWNVELGQSRVEPGYGSVGSSGGAIGGGPPGPPGPPAPPPPFPRLLVS